MFFDARPDNELRLYLMMRTALERGEALAAGPSDPVTLPSGEISTRAEIAEVTILMKERQAARWDRLTGYLQRSLAPSLIVLVLGLMLGWAIRGFSRSGSK